MTKGIFATGSGEVRAAPDIAIVTLGVETVAVSVAEARRMNADAANKLIDALRAAGVAQGDTQTTGLSINPNYDHRPDGPAVIVGYTVSNNVQVTLRDPPSAGATIDSALEAVGDAGRLQGIRYTFSNPEPLWAEARLKASLDARTRALAFAAGAGVRLGKVLAVVEEHAGGGPQPRFREALMAASTPIEPGESTITAKVTIRYAIKN